MSDVLRPWLVEDVVCHGIPEDSPAFILFETTFLRDGFIRDGTQKGYAFGNFEFVNCFDSPRVVHLRA